MSDLYLDEFETEVLQIWESLRPKDESYIISPSSPGLGTQATETFLNYLNKPEDPSRKPYPDVFDERLGALFHSLIEFCTLHPRSMDWTLHILDNILKNVPLNAKTDHGTGPGGARSYLRWYLLDFTRFYEGNVEPDVGVVPLLKEDVVDSSTVQFTLEEVQKCTDDVIAKVVNLRKDRWKSMIMVILSGRCYALNVVRANLPLSEGYVEKHGYPGDNLVNWIDKALDLGPRPGIPQWNRVDCIAALTMLRGCAKSLVETIPIEKREEKKTAWVEGVNRLLVTDGGGRKIGDKADNFHLKAHAALALKNLRNGFEDEQSAKLFEVGNWMF